MPHIQNRGVRDFSKYDAMSDEALEQLLRDDFSKPEGEESDTEELIYITEVLAQRRKERKEDISPVQAWESFQQNYYTEDEDPCVSEIVPASKKKGSGHWRRGLVAAAAVLVLIVGGSITAHAFKFDLWGIFVNWRKETFHFGSATNATDSQDVGEADPPKYTGLQEALLEYEIDLALAPTWLPDGYEEGEVRFTEMPSRRVFTTQYRRGDESIRVRISNYANADSLQIEQSGELIEIYVSDGIDYYIFSNHDQLRAAWINESYECFIMGPLSVTEIKIIIDSIGKG